MFVFATIVIIVALGILFFAGDSSAIAGLSGDQFASLVALALFGTLIASGIVASRQRFGTMVRQLAIWVAIVLALVAGYEYRYELQDVASRVTAGLIPGSPVSTSGADGRRLVTITRNRNHFEARAQVNGAPMRFVVDTGASTVVLTFEDAARAGLDIEALRYIVPVMTANGQTQAAPVRIETLSVGGIERTNVAALVAEDGQLFENLLGMNFLDTLAGFEVTGDRLILRD